MLMTSAVIRSDVYLVSGARILTALMTMILFSHKAHIRSANVYF